MHLPVLLVQNAVPIAAGVGSLFALSGLYSTVRGVKRRFFPAKSKTPTAPHTEKTRTRTPNSTRAASPETRRPEPTPVLTDDHDTLPDRVLRALSNDLSAARGPSIALAASDPRKQTIALGVLIDDAFYEDDSNYESVLTQIRGWLLNASQRCQSTEQVANLATLVDLYHSDQSSRGKHSTSGSFSLSYGLVDRLTRTLLELSVDGIADEDTSRDLLKDYLTAQVEGADIQDDPADIVSRFVGVVRSTCEEVVGEFHHPTPVSVTAKRTRIVESESQPLNGSYRRSRDGL